MIFDAQRPVILCGISELATRGDLADRAVALALPRIPDEKRMLERDLDLAFTEARPRILGALLGAVAGALAGVDFVCLRSLPRMADFAHWIVAAEPALGWPDGAFMAAYAANRESANEITLEASPVAIALRTLKQDFTGTATELLAALEPYVNEQVKRTRAWPSNPRSLANALRRLAPNLARAEVEVTFSGRHYPRTLEVRISSPSSSTSPKTQQNQAFFAGDRGR